MSEAEGLLLVDKPAGPTSHDVVQWVRWALRERSVGHCGTLDPAATGLLVVCVGASTKLVEYLSAADKTYEARFLIGVATDSADVDGTETARARVTPEQARAATDVLKSMHGPLMLPPPALSAVKVDGKRAHALARAGEHVELEPRPMHVLDPPWVGEPEPGPADTWVVPARLRVAKGTYVRSLAVELGRRLGLPVQLAALHRTHSGTAGLEHPACVRDLAATPTARGYRIRPRGIEERGACRERLVAAVLDPAPFVPFERLTVPAPLLTRLSQGQRLSGREPAFAALIASDNARAWAVAERAPGLSIVVRRELAEDGEPRIAPEKVLRSAGTASEEPPGA